MEVIDNLLSGIYVIIGTACVLVLIAIFAWSKGVIGDIETRGSSIALSEKILSAPCLNLADATGSPEKLVFSKDALDKYNNKAVCEGVPGAPDVSGTLYYMEITSSLGTWHFKNNDNEDYAYNTHARGIGKGCVSDRGTFLYSNVGGVLGFKTLIGSPFKYGSGGNYLRYSGVINDGDTQAMASIKVIIDADSGTDFYEDGYPLCLCDIKCPYEKCICSKKCDRSKETVGFGVTCT